MLRSPLKHECVQLSPEFCAADVLPCLTDWQVSYSRYVVHLQ